jgi:hypothetical protein
MHHVLSERDLASFPAGNPACRRLAEPSVAEPISKTARNAAIYPGSSVVEDEAVSLSSLNYSADSLRAS